VSDREMPRLAWVTLGLLLALSVTNVIFLIVLRTGGPLFGVSLYTVLLVRARRGGRSDYRATMAGALVGTAVHVLELLALGWSPYPSLMALNLILPAVLAPVAWLADRELSRQA